MMVIVPNIVPVSFMHVLRRHVSAAVHLGHGLSQPHHGLQLSDGDAPGSATTCTTTVTLT